MSTTKAKPIVKKTEHWSKLKMQVILKVKIGMYIIDFFCSIDKHEKMIEKFKMRLKCRVKGLCIFINLNSNTITF